MKTALDRAILNEEKGITYASNLKFYIEDEGLYGVTLKDIRDGHEPRAKAQGM